MVDVSERLLQQRGRACVAGASPSRRGARRRAQREKGEEGEGPPQAATEGEDFRLSLRVAVQALLGCPGRDPQR